MCIMPSLKKLLREHPVYILSLLFNEEKVSERDYVIKNLRPDVVHTPNENREVVYNDHFEVTFPV